MPSSSSTKTISSIIAVAAVASGSYCSWLYLSKQRAQANKETTSQTTPDSNYVLVSPDTSQPDISPAAEAKDLGMNMQFSDPRNLIAALHKRLRRVQSSKELKEISQILGNGKVDLVQYKRLENLFIENKMQFSEKSKPRLIGELKAGKASRWAIPFSHGTALIQLDIAKQKNGFLEIKNVEIPPPALISSEASQDPDGLASSRNGADAPQANKTPKPQAPLNQADAMNYVHNFVKSLIRFDYAKARSMTNPKGVSDAKIAGLCILFEEGDYQLNQEKPLQTIRFKETISAFYVNLVAKKETDAKQAQFSTIVSRNAKKDPWLIDEINLDKLLEDYAARVAGGDAYYTPIIKNPNGGETLVTYFDFDSEGLTERTKRQLSIIAQILKTDHNKKVTLSGHTDSKGTDQYNQGLSKNRAKAVKAYLVEIGVLAKQIQVESHGFTKPRRKENNEDGSDDPNARKINRRTEIYLDF